MTKAGYSELRAPEVVAIILCVPYQHQQSAAVEVTDPVDPCLSCFLQGSDSHAVSNPLSGPPQVTAMHFWDQLWSRRVGYSSASISGRLHLLGPDRVA